MPAATASHSTRRSIWTNKMCFLTHGVAWSRGWLTYGVAWSRGWLAQADRFRVAARFLSDLIGARVDHLALWRWLRRTSHAAGPEIDEATQASLGRGTLPDVTDPGPGCYGELDGGMHRSRGDPRGPVQARVVEIRSRLGPSGLRFASNAGSISLPRAFPNEMPRDIVRCSWCMPNAFAYPLSNNVVKDRDNTSGSRSVATNHPGEVVEPMDPLVYPRYAGPSTFARLPRVDDAPTFDVAIVGVPYDSGVTYRPGARFGPAGIRQASRLLRPYHHDFKVRPFHDQQVVDAGDIACNPFDVSQAYAEIQRSVSQLLGGGERVISLGGDHSISLPLLRAVSSQEGPVTLLHFDAHLDTFDTYFGQNFTHGTSFRRASEEGLIDTERSLHVGIRGPVYDETDIAEDGELGFMIIPARVFEDQGVAGVASAIRDRLGNAQTYVSIDIDVLDPAYSPGTGTPEPGGISTRELLGVLENLSGMSILSADLVEVSPILDHAEITSTAASRIVYELLSLMALSSAPR